MLESAKIQRRMSEVRQELNTLSTKADPTDDEVRSMGDLGKEYETLEVRFRASLIAEDEERREAGAELETRSDRERSDLMGRFELAQVVAVLGNERRSLDGATAEVVEELRSMGGFEGIPVPLEALETRAGETVASGTPDPITTRPIVDRLFADTVAARMGTQFITIPQGATEWPVVTQGASAAWADGETGSIGAAQAFQTVDKSLSPDHTYGVAMKLTRKALKQSGTALEQAVRRDMNSAISVGLDAAVFQGTGANGQPLGVLPGAATYGITETAIDAAATWAAIRAAVVRFMTANAASSASSVRMMLRPEIWDTMDDTAWDAGSGMTEWDRLVKHLGAGNVMLSTNGLATPAGDPAASSALLTTSAGGLAPIFAGLWGGVDLIRDPFTDASSGTLRLTALLTADVTVARGAQLEILTGLQ